MLSRPMIDRIAFLGISWYAILIVAAILIGLAFCTREARRLHVPQETIIDFLLMAICIFIFVKLISKLHRKKEVPAPAPAPKRLCPFCRMEIADDATRCPHCTSEIAE